MDPELTLALFWALATLCVLVALALVLRPLFKRQTTLVADERRRINIAVYRDQLQELTRDRDNGLLSPEQYEAAKLELEARLAEDALREATAPQAARQIGRWLGYALGVSLPVAAIGLYLVLGNPAAITQPRLSPGMGAHDLEAMVRSVEERARANPNDPRPVLLLARTYAAMERWPQALAAYEKAVRLLPEDASVWAGYAETLALSRGRDLRGQPMELVRKALALNGDEPTALNLAGIHAFMEGDYAQAVVYWQRLARQLPAGSEQAQAVQDAIREARARAAAAGTPLPEPQAETGTAQTADKTIRGRVEIAPALKDRLPADATLFIIARPAGGGGAPVAVLRLAASLPQAFELSDAQAMSKDQRLSSQTEVDLVARVSRSGQAMPTSGDLEGELKRVRPGGGEVRLVIDRVRP
ncbi:MAG: c-type cytochrome biogenesis protein CcmI [Thiobacillaceae bacterium]|nr:c-type cytochrome biogenesis protein CcmI [Thiobacillaceae bacterium]MDW8323709.1 c-type cytochrome biogenesis protein CcmI [Burkholderiales bacterium]